MKVISIITRSQKKKIVEEKDETFAEMNWFQKILFIINVPFDYLRKITIPPCNKEEYNKWYCIAVSRPIQQEPSNNPPPHSHTHNTLRPDAA